MTDRLSVLFTRSIKMQVESEKRAAKVCNSCLPVNALILVKVRICDFKNFDFKCQDVSAKD